MGESALKAIVTAENGARSDLGYQVVEYPHIHRRHVVQPADVRVKVMDVTVAPGVKVGYVMGVGDKVPEAIQQLGADLKMIDADTLASGDLSQFDVIMLGVRAYERRQDLRANNQRLLDYAAGGGTVIVQYQRTEFNEAQYGPYPAKTTAERVTDENAPIEILVPDHPLFTTPNRIGPDAWRGWVQERGTYFMGAARSALRRSRALAGSFLVQCWTQDRHPGGSARREGPVDLHRPRPVAAAAGGHRRRLPPVGQLDQPWDTLKQRVSRANDRR